MKDKILSLVESHDQWREHQSLNLIPSENIMSPAVRSLLSSGLGQRYSSRDRFYTGTKFLDDIERYGEELAREVFRAETADLRPLSGHIADFIVLASLAKANDTVMCLSADDGGYPGIGRDGLSNYLRLEIAEFPFLKEKMNLDIEKAKELIREKRPRMVIFGASLFLFPHPVKPLARVAHEVGAHVGYDGSHVLGLIAGKEFQDPLREGASMLFGSTHKSFFGPQGGIILADKDHGDTLRKRIYPAFVDNIHWNRVAALALALAEMKEFGKTYATLVVRNAQSLAKALADHGLPVACPNLGFTKSHQVFLDYGGFGKGKKVAESLERANIIADRGVRFGVCELTRRGMKQNEMQTVAEFIKRVIIDGEKPQKVKAEVTRFVSKFREVRFCFE